MTRFTVDHHLAKPEHFVFKRIDSSSRVVFFLLLFRLLFICFGYGIVFNDWLFITILCCVCIRFIYTYIKLKSSKSLTQWDFTLNKTDKIKSKEWENQKKFRNFSLCMRSIKRPMNNFEWVKKCCSLLSVELIFSWFHCAFDVTILRIRPTIPAL